MNRFFRHARGYVADNWQAGLAVLSVIGVLLLLLGYKLGTLVGGLSQSEFELQQLLAQNAVSISSILRDPLYLPYDIALYLTQLSPFHGPTMLRAIGVLFGLLGALGLFSILRRWYTTRMALFGTILFVSSTWFLHTARYASPESSYLLLPLLIAAVIALKTKSHAKRFSVAVTVFGFMALYIPGVVWFLLPAVILQRKTIIKALLIQPIWFRAIIAAISILMLIPAVVMLVSPAVGGSGIQNAFSLLGLPTTFLSLTSIADNAWQALASIFVVSNAGPLYTLGRLPWLDISTSVLVVIGILQFIRHRSLARSKLIGIVAAASIVLIALGGVSNLVLLPFVFLLAVEGMKRLLSMWLSVFPRNPLARSFGVGLIALLVLGIGLYNTTRYFVAWPSTPETRQQFDKIP